MPETKLFAFPEYKITALYQISLTEYLGRVELIMPFIQTLKPFLYILLHREKKRHFESKGKKKWRRGSDIVKDEKAGNKLNACKSTFFPSSIAKV